VLTLLVATIPIVLGAWLAASNLGGRERDRADAELQRSLHGARAEFASAVSAADRDARRLAAKPEVQRAVLRADRRAAATIARRSARVVLFARGRLLAGSAATTVPCAR
jgi:Flp pilus assembly protein TadB